jgi:hypothetical protein
MKKLILFGLIFFSSSLAIAYAQDYFMFRQGRNMGSDSLGMNLFFYLDIFYLDCVYI